jgi:pantetheine-phosphate adenylyltransferase
MRALYPGSFDPVHLGHLGVIEQVSRDVDGLIVAVLANPAKPTGLFGRDERVRLLATSTEHLSNVVVVGSEGLAVDVARREGADVIVRAAHKGLANERAMAAVNERASGLTTLFVVPAPGVASISSTVVRELVAAGEIEAACRLVPPAVAAALSLRGGTAPAR